MFRGYEASVFGRNPRPPPPTSDDPGEGIELPATREDGEAGEPPAEDVSDLVLIVHGIGQAMTVNHESFNSLCESSLSGRGRDFPLPTLVSGSIDLLAGRLGLTPGL